MTIKKSLLDVCVKSVDSRIEHARKTMEHAQASANEETKSSAGDKYETGRAMAQMERDKSAVQMTEAIRIKDFLQKINTSLNHEKAELGALVVTNLGTYFLAVGLGKVSAEGKDIFVIAPGSPVGAAMLGKKAGESFSFLSNTYLISEIF